MIATWEEILQAGLQTGGPGTTEQTVRQALQRQIAAGKVQQVGPNQFLSFDGPEISQGRMGGGRGGGRYYGGRHHQGGGYQGGGYHRGGYSGWGGQR